MLRLEAAVTKSRAMPVCVGRVDTHVGLLTWRENEN